jgi:hypothetical protein
MTIKKELLAERKRLDAEIRKLAELRSEIAQELGGLNCPYAIGDLLKDRKGIIWEITVIGPGWGDDDYRMKGRRVLKGGGLGRLEHHLWQDFEKVLP